MPSTLVTVLRSELVSTWRIATTTVGSAAPDGSVILPCTLPVEACGNAGVTDTSAIHTDAHRRALRLTLCMAHPLRRLGRLTDRSVSLYITEGIGRQSVRSRNRLLLVVYWLRNRE